MESKIWALVVDDEPGIRELIVEKFGEAIPQISWIQSGDAIEASNKLHLQSFSLVITDINLPRKDGTWLIKEIKALPRGFIPQKVMLIGADNEGPQLSSKIGNVEFYQKPLNFELMIKSVKDHFFPAPKPAGTIDVEFINPFIESTLKVIETNSKIVPVRSKLFLKNSDQPAQGDISSVIAMNSNSFLGSFSITFDEGGYLKVINGMLGESFTKITADIQDGAAEICNQIFGGAKAVLNEKGHSIMPAIPTVVTGHGHQIKHMISGPILVAEFLIGENKFTIEAVTQKTSK